MKSKFNFYQLAALQDKTTMVRVGEFSPANPDLQAPGKALLGLGEYEERRRQLLEKKKQEYKEYLSHSRNVLQRTDHLMHHSPQRRLIFISLLWTGFHRIIY